MSSRLLLGGVLLLDALLGALHHDAGEGKQGDGVGQNHEIVEEVGQLPNQVVADHGTHQHEDQRNDGVDDGAALGILLAEEVVGIDLTKQVPAQNGGECEEEQADSHEDGAELLAEDHTKCGLGKIGLGQHGAGSSGAALVERATLGVEGGDDDESVQGQHHEGVDEHTGHSHNALIVGVSHVSLRVSVGGRTHTGLVGEQAALSALRNSSLDSSTEATADDGLRHEGILEDHADGSGNVLDTGNQHDEAAQQEDTGHNGHDLLRDGSQALHAAQEDDTADDHQHDTHNPGGDTESGIERLTDGVGLDHAAHEAQRQHDSHSEEAGKELTEAALEGMGDVVHGAALDVAVSVHSAGLLCQGSLSVDGSHAEEGDDPHPEDSAGATHQDSTGSTDDVTGTHLCGDSGSQCLERAHTGLLLLTAEREGTKDLLHTLAEAANLHEAGTDGEPQTHSDQQDHQHVVGYVSVNVTDNRIQCVFNSLHCLFPPNKIKRAAEYQQLRRCRRARKSSCVLCPFA